MKAILKKVPDLDFFIGIFGGNEVPTKQDKFKPLAKGHKVISDTGKEIELTNLDIYLKNPSKNSLKEFEEKFKEQIKVNLTSEHPYGIDTKLEIIISVSMDEHRIKEVDVDNLSKAVMDCFNGLLFVDDNQVQNLLASKHVNSFSPLNGLMVGVRKLNSEDNSWFKNIKLAYFEYTPTTILNDSRAKKRD